MTEARWIRWKQAQLAELKWWSQWRQLPFYRNHSFPEYWQSVLTDVLGDYQCLAPDVVAEVGCGPHGVVRYLFPNSRLKIGMDPLIRDFEDRPISSSQSSYIAALGEDIPLRDASADLVFCINVLDHVLDPNQILREIRRILKPGGMLVLEVHTFPRLFRPFLLLDHPHTFHWTKRDVHRLVDPEVFAIQKTADRAFPVEVPWRSWFIPSHWKYAFGKRFMRLTYVYCRKPV